MWPQEALFNGTAIPSPALLAGVIPQLMLCMILNTRKCLLTDKELACHGLFKQLDFRGLVSGSYYILYIFCRCCKIPTKILWSRIFFSEIPSITPSNSSHKILIISILCKPFSALTSFYLWQITISSQSLHARHWVRSWEWNTNQSKESKGESQENGGRGVPCKLCWLFRKYFVSVIKMASMDLRVGLKPTCTSREEVDSMKF